MTLKKLWMWLVQLASNILLILVGSYGVANPSFVLFGIALRPAVLVLSWLLIVVGVVSLVGTVMDGVKRLFG